MLATRSAFGAARGAMRPCGLRTVSIVAPSVVRPMEQSSFLGSSMSATSLVRGPARGSLVCMASKVSMGCTISGKGSNRKRRTTSGYMTRKETPQGRKVLKARMKKGRKVLCPASQKKSGGKK